VRRVEEVAEQVQGAPVVLRGDLDAGHDLQDRARRGAGQTDAGERVVVGDGEGGQPAAARQFHDLGGGVGAVAASGVYVQVGAGGPGQDLTQGGERLAPGHGGITRRASGRGGAGRARR